MIFWNLGLILRIDTLFMKKNEEKSTLVRKEIGLGI
jgi:hypothetical protein